MSVSMLVGTVFFSQAFAFFMAPGARVVSPDMAFYIAAGLLLLTTVLFVSVRKKMAG
jgi:DHA1 family tetracycline resistance protein-like MFS transporter